MKIDEKGTSSDFDLDDTGSVFDRYKRNFLLLFVIIAIYGVMFLLYATGIIGLLVADVVLAPITLIIIGIYLKTKNKH